MSPDKSPTGKPGKDRDRVRESLDSRISGFYKLSMNKRLKVLKGLTGLTVKEAATLANTGGLSAVVADKMIENVVGGITIPMGIATNFRINSNDYLVPMALEEPSVIAAASNAAKIARMRGGFRVTSTGSVMIGQIQVVDTPDPHRAVGMLLAKKEEILSKANEHHTLLISRGGGAKDLHTRILSTLKGPMVIAELEVNTGDAMGANAVDTMAEAIAPLVEEISGGRVLLRIVSNLADRRLINASAVFDKDAVGGRKVVDDITFAYLFAEADPHRCSTHNKGVMNGVVPVALACGQDTRALEAGAHSYASRSGTYKPLTTWVKDANGDLFGCLQMPMAVGLVGGASKTHPVARTAIKILGVSTAVELAEVMGAVGLAANFAALRALVTEGIQRGHTRLHSRNIALAAGATGKMVEKVAEKMVREREIRMDRAREILAEMMENEARPARKRV